MRVEVLRTADVRPATLAQIRTLMDVAFDGDFDDDDWDHTLGGWHAMALDHDRVLAHAAVVDRVLHVGEHAFRTGYVEGVATMPEVQHQGLGTLVMTEIGTIIRRDVELGALGTGEWAYYEKLGWERWRGPTYLRTADGLVRTEGDDDGVMVLRFGRSAGIDLTGPIACEERAGDVW